MPTEILSTKTYSQISIPKQKYNFVGKIVCENIENIIAVNCKPSIKNYEAISQNISISGVAKIEVCYTNKEGAICTSTDLLEFAPRFEAQAAEKYLFCVNEKETIAKIVAENEVAIYSTFEICADGVVASTIETPKVDGPNIYQLTKKIDVQNLSAMSDDKIIVTDESEISATQIVKCEAACIATKVVAAEDALVVDGELLVWVVSQIEGTLKSTFKRIEFSNEVQALGSKQGDKCCFELGIENCVATIANEGTGATLSISATLKSSAVVFRTEQIDVVDDIYSTDVELKVTTSGTDIQNFVEKKYKETDLTATLSTKDKNINMGSILAVVSPVFVAGEKPTIECTVLYRHAETDKIESTILSCQAPNFECLPQIVVKSFNKKKAKEIEVELSLISCDVTFNHDYTTFVSAVEEGSAIEPDGKAIVVYQARCGQTLFDIAKALCCSPETLRSQNNDLEDVLSQDKKVVLYKKSCNLF